MLSVLIVALAVVVLFLWLLRPAREELDLFGDLERRLEDLIERKMAEAASTTVQRAARIRSCIQEIVK